MSHDDWAQVQALFDAVCDLPPAERDAALSAPDVLPGVRREVEELLAHDGAAGLDRFADQVRSTAEALDHAALAGTEIGPWRLLRRLGSGGMGDVFLAERADGRFEARAAIKFVAGGGEGAVRLFERERRILARMDHPAIARMFDAGEHPQLGAYLVMEYIDGRPLDQHVAVERLDPLAVVRWVARVAEVLAHAHGRLILHRDLKPAHLLVTPDDQLKVLDFGIAGLLETDDGTTTAPGSYTPRYASPEQILHQATTMRTDLFAVGLLLHELLADGRSPFGDDCEQWSARKLAGQRDPLPRPPGVGRRRWRDLDAILGRCLAPPEAPGYASVSDLETDLQAVLDDRPVRARSTGTLEAMLRWIGRYRLASASIAVALSAVLVGSGVSLWFARQAQAERDLAVIEAEKARQITAFLEAVFTTATPGVGKGPDTPVRVLLDEGAERIGRDLDDQPDIAAYLELAIARSYMFLGLYDQAHALLDRPEPDPPTGDPATWTERGIVMARIDLLRGRYAEALARLDALRDRPMDDIVRARLELRRAESLVNTGDTAGASDAAERILTLADDTPAGLTQRAGALNMLGVIAYNLGDYEEAQARFEQMLEVHLDHYGEVHGTTSMTLFNLGGVALARGEVDDALGYYQRAVAAFETLFEVDNRTVAIGHRALGIAHQRAGDAAAAERHLVRALTALEHWNGRENPAWQEAGLKLVELQLLRGRTDDALQLLAELPNRAVDELASHQQVACRTERLQALLGLIPPPGTDCTAGRLLPAFSRALEHLVEARSARTTDPATFTRARTAGRTAVAELTVPEPLLEAAYDDLDRTPEP
ncbi:protein kinase [Wenzhouxiangella sp. XN79A]|uniref:protein kinase domain-containing protein n=1 Tax=Wenzhouxiangella sp. XN79A TaxID=2724193 RepID=UPI00144AA972|nr:serine/threonine-protein kinase [Wenzhouxiangella sp. XN79A]NKI35622.1 protein kinase [Wenzhouxiangella sp. XN79A]